MNARVGTISKPLKRLIVAALWLIIPLAAGGLVLSMGFDGLYGQDPFAYYDYATVDLARQLIPPPPFFWPPGYSLLVFLVSRIIGVTPLAGQLVSLASGGLAVLFTALLARELWPHDANGNTAAWVAGLCAGLALATMGQLWQSSAVLMADTVGLACMTGGLWALARYVKVIRSHSPESTTPLHDGAGFGVRSTWLMLAAGSIAYAIITRYAYAPLALVCTVYALFFMLRHLTLPRIAVHGLMAALSAGIILAPVMIPALTSATDTETTFGGNFGRQFRQWDITNAVRKDFENPDGFFHFAQPNGLYYTNLVIQDYYFVPLLAIFALPGLLVLIRSRAFGTLAYLGGVFIGLYLLLVGLPQQNVRFGLAYMPSVAVLIGMGMAAILATDTKNRVPTNIARMIQITAVGVFCVGLAWGVRSAVNYTQTFIARHQDNLATVRWTADQLPPDAQLIAFGLTATVQHYTPFETYEIYNLTTDDLDAIMQRDQPTYLLLDVYNVRTQWKGRTPEIHYNRLRTHYGLTEVGKRGYWTLLRVGKVENE